MSGLILEKEEKTYQKEEIKISKGYLVLKYVFDCIVAVVALLICALPMLIVAICIRLESPGPVIYKQERLGKGGKPFVMYKFRSMTVDAEKNGKQWATVNDCRVTKTGRIIRAFHVDELPQLWNVLKGEMSIVGPRPERPHFYSEFEMYIPQFRDRLAVRPGLTGLAQINGGYDLKPEEKIVYDMEYIHHCSVGMDINCILKTIPQLITRKGVR